MNQGDILELSRIVVDIGASTGAFANFMADRATDSGNSRVSVVAVEPIHSSAAQIQSRTNLIVIQKAISSEKGRKLLRVTKNPELSSFKPVNPEIDRNLWDFHLSFMEIVEEVMVDCITLEELINELNIREIDFLKIDTQGTDLEVFLSAGPNLSRIKSAVLEFPFTQDSCLYENEVDVTEAIRILGNKGFFPIRLVPNGAGECNLFICNSNYSINDYLLLEKELRFNNAPALKFKNLDDDPFENPLDLVVNYNDWHTRQSKFRFRIREYILKNFRFFNW
jgi:FkbM family methyltransferase